MTIIVQQLSHSGPLTFMIKETDPPGKEKLGCSSGNFQKRGRRDREGHWFLGRVQECGRGGRDLRLWIFKTWVSKTEINRLLYQGPKQKNYKDVVWPQERNNNNIRSLTIYACPLQNKKDYIKLFSSSLLQQHISVHFLKNCNDNQTSYLSGIDSTRKLCPLPYRKKCKNYILHTIRSHQKTVQHKTHYLQGRFKTVYFETIKMQKARQALQLNLLQC